MTQHEKALQFDPQPTLTNEQRQQRSAMEVAGSALAGRGLMGYQQHAAAKEALARIAPEATGDFRDELLYAFAYFNGYTDCALRTK